MSKAMSEREIEDVLDSVRRMIAQEERRRNVPPLVLTPEMRVTAEDDASANPTTSAPSEGPNTPPAPDAGMPYSAPASDAKPAGVEAVPESKHTADSLNHNLPQPGAGPALPMTMDDAAMQEMVAQIVRDELHGKLGERITLAVRKLVRNEIARAMDEQRRK